MPAKRLAPEPLETIGVRMPASQKRRLFDMAWERRTTASELVRQAFEAFSGKAV